MKAFLWILLATPAMADVAQLPSGQPVELFEKVIDQRGSQGLTWRYRFLAPQIARAAGIVTSQEAFKDIEALCAAIAVPEVTASDAPPAQVVISLMDQPVAFGTAAPEATQYFEAYRILDAECLWDGF